jgi:hypothetical protein
LTSIPSNAGVLAESWSESNAREIPRAGFSWSMLALPAVLLMAATFAGLAPLGCSIITVFLFAGPHNWFEARYMLSRMPAKWGPLRPYFLLGIGGTILLTSIFAAMPYAADLLHWQQTDYLTAIAVWNTLLVSWIVGLALLRSRQNPRRDWAWLMPVGTVVIAVNWLRPLAWSQALVYLHPLMALWFLDRELAHQPRAWRTAYRTALGLLPLCLLGLWWLLGSTPNLPGDDPLSAAIARHAGAEIISGVSTRFLVAAHVFLELLHYAAWIIAIPLASHRSLPWQISAVPLAKRSSAWRRAILGVVLLGLAIMLILWGAFLADYPTTREVYFTVAMLHVLAEIPFLLRLL